MQQLPPIIRSLPVLVLNIHSRCNCRCVMCDIWKRQSTQELTVAQLYPHRAAWRRLSLRWVVLSGGEPLLHSDLPALCKLFRDDGIRVTLLTTGLLLAKRAQEIAEFVDDIIVSLDGPSEVHDSVRRIRGAFDLIAKGVSAVRTHRPSMRIAARTTVQKANRRHLLASVDASRQLGFDNISFLAADLTSEAFNRPEPWAPSRQNEIALAPDEVDELDAEIERLIEARTADITSGYVAEDAAKLRRIVTHFRAHLSQAIEHAPACNAPWKSAVIEADGAVRPCFFHPPIGNIHEGPLDQVLNGGPALQFRGALDIDSDPTCRRCVCSLNWRDQSALAQYSQIQTTMRGIGIQPLRQL